MARVRSGGTSSGGILRMLEQKGMRQGVFGNSKGWLYVGTGLWTVRTIRRLSARQTEILISEELKPGQRIIIANGVATVDGTPTDEPQTGRRGRRSRRRG